MAPTRLKTIPYSRTLAPRIARRRADRLKEGRRIGYAPHRLQRVDGLRAQPRVHQQRVAALERRALWRGLRHCLVELDERAHVGEREQIGAVARAAFEDVDVAVDVVWLNAFIAHGDKVRDEASMGLLDTIEALKVRFEAACDGPVLFVDGVRFLRSERRVDKLAVS